MSILKIYIILFLQYNNTKLIQYFMLKLSYLLITFNTLILLFIIIYILRQ